jgi:2,5-dichlorohydroquinone reductive dechlorinase
MTNRNETLDTLVANARRAIGGVSAEFGAGGDLEPRFELFHAPNSICSQKVRTVLVHHGLRFLSHSLNLFTGQTYLPDYVRLRMRGCDSHGGDLATHHSGSTATSAGGCDGAVVPTLVDRATGQVLVDSKRICLYLDDLTPEAKRLIPPAHEDAVGAELTTVDNLPNYQMLMGRKQPSSESQVSRTMTGAIFSERKAAWCDAYLAQYADDPPLRRAYEAKRAKELSAAAGLFSQEAMRHAHDRAEASVQALECRLANRAGGWLFGGGVTMADLFWGIELLRMRNVGAEEFWVGGKLPLVTEFLMRVEKLPSIRSAVLDWPGAMF